MTHTEALNLILAHACPQANDDDVSTFVFDLHCQEVTVKARLVSTFQTIQYEILSVTL